MNNTAVYAGTFDPITHGHTDLVKRTRLMFGRVIVAVADNPEKNPMFSLEQRIKMAREVLGDLEHVEVIGFSGLLIDFVRSMDARIILRGLRALSDFEFEFQLASMNRHLDCEIETVFLTPSENFTFVSASLVKEVAKYGGDVSDFVHPLVHRALKDQVRVPSLKTSRATETPS